MRRLFVVSLLAFVIAGVFFVAQSFGTNQQAVATSDAITAQPFADYGVLSIIGFGLLTLLVWPYRRRDTARESVK